MPIIWEYATLAVEWAWIADEEKWEYTATGSQDDRVFYTKVFNERYWSVPLGDMGRMGWELVGSNAQNVLAQSWVKGYPGSISTPVFMVFFFKRLKED